MVLATSGCSSLGRKAAEAGFDAAKDAGEKWWNEGGKEKVQALAGDLANKAKDEAKSYAKRKSDESRTNLEVYLGKSLENAGVKDLPSLYKEVRDREKESGQPYKPITGSLITDLLLAAYSASLASKATQAGAAKLLSKPAVPPKT